MLSSPSQNAKRILIITSDAGFGHRRSAQAVEKALLKLYGDNVKVQVVNPISDTEKALLLKSIEKNYNTSVKNTPNLYRLGYQLSDNRPISDMMDGALMLALTASLKEVIADFRPQAILNTNEMFNSAIGAALDKLDIHMPYYNLVTDLADVHALWFNKDPDAYFLASDWVRVRAIENKIPAEKLIVSGIPVDPGFEDRLEDKSDLRRALGIDPHKTTLLFVGGERVENVLETVQALDRLDHDFQVVAIAGGSQKLHQNLLDLKPNFPLHVLNFTEKMSEWLQAADILLTKAGGLILSEGLAAGLPIVIIHYLPGQEEGNVRYVLSFQAGAHPANAEETLALLNYWLRDNQSALRLVTQAAQTLGKPKAASFVAQTLWDSIKD